MTKLPLCLPFFADKLKYPSSKFQGAPDELSIIGPNLIRKPVEKSEYYKSLESYFKQNELYDSFRMCMLTTLDKNGNTKQTSFLKTPLKNLDPQLLSHLENTTEERNAEHNRNATDEPNLSTWMLTAEEKVEEELRKHRERVWMVAVQNQDYISRTKAL
ncbi:hypothetical protein Y032_0040g320 [Ancylostoma ceylanicum]|nr:hypothetical protein Y032_0040g320 [Ancylostoma ceylanicum]